MAVRRTEMSYDVTNQLLKLGFPRSFADTIGEQMNTDFVARQMLGYLREVRPRKAELVVDEMLSILELRRQCIEKQINKKRQRDVDDLYIRGFSINWNHPVSDTYVSSIEALRSIKEISFSKNITFFSGENGSGKSTLLEGLAVACGLNPEGGTANYHFHTYDDYSHLGSAIKLVRGCHRPKWSYFLRAESFYNVASAAVRDYNEGGPPLPDYHARSHGESFLEFIREANESGLYLMDEPEAALSPQRQLTLLIHLSQMAEAGAQFIIATHSPILLGTPNAEIFSFDEGKLHTVSYEETESYQVTKLFLENKDIMLKRLLQ